MKFAIVDAFSDKIFGGNQAGVVIIPEEENFPKKELMLKVAGELKYSETAFIKKISPNKFKTKYFTPVAEVDLCGHATIGAFYFLLQEGLVKAGSKYVNKTLAGDLEIEVEEDSILMEMAQPKELLEFSKEKDKEELYRILGLENIKLDFNPKIISTGLADIIVPVENKRDLEKISPDFQALKEISKKYNVVGFHVFSTAIEEEKIHTRNFAPLYGIDEEAATGTANGALTYYLYKYNVLNKGEKNTIIQGEKMGRPSKILTLLTITEGKEKIQVGGFGVTVAKGEINI